MTYSLDQYISWHICLCWIFKSFKVIFESFIDFVSIIIIFLFYFAYIRQKGSCYFRHEFLICQWHFSCSWESETRIQHSCDQQCDCYSPLHLYQLHQLYSGPHLQKAPGLTFVFLCIFAIKYTRVMTQETRMILTCKYLSAFFFKSSPNSKQMSNFEFLQL